MGALDEDATAGRDDDAVADFSSRGTKYSAAKPDLVAPGVSLVSTAAPDSIAVTDNEESVLEGDRYMRGSGTSMSAAVVTGAVAAVLQANGTLAPNGVKALLTRSTYSRWPDSTMALARAHWTSSGPLAAAGAPPNPRPGVTTPRPRRVGAQSRPTPRLGRTSPTPGSPADFEAVKAAWAQLSPQTQVWGARIFA